MNLSAFYKKKNTYLYISPWVFLAGISGFFKVVGPLRTETGFRHNFQFTGFFLLRKAE